MQNTTERLLVALLLSLLGLVAGVHKLLGDFPPAWFEGKFSESLIGMVPGGIALSFGIIVLLELAIPALFCAAIVKREHQQEGLGRFAGLSFNIALILFIVLFFGSFLVQDYDNGFQDFLYFVRVVILRWRWGSSLPNAT